MIDELTLDSDALDSLPEQVLLSLIGNLAERSHDFGCDAYHTAEWVEDSEGKTWDLPCYLLQVGTRAILWSKTDEAGIQDVTITDAEDDLDEQVTNFSQDLAAHFG